MIDIIENMGGKELKMDKNDLANQNEFLKKHYEK